MKKTWITWSTVLLSVVFSMVVISVSLANETTESGSSSDEKFEMKELAEGFTAPMLSSTEGKYIIENND